MSSEQLAPLLHLTALPAGYRLQGYVIERVLGQGSFGITYKALDTNSNVFVAIKEYFPREFSSRENGSAVLASGNQQDIDDFAWGLKKFVEEANTLTRFEHPNLVSVQRFFRSNGTAYLVMDYCDGEPLDAILDRQNTLEYQRIASILTPLLDGLECVHLADVVHRDIKPGNIFIRANGTPVLLDFGNARNELSNHSRSVASVATPGYGAPEQYGSRLNLGPWTDIYGMAATVYRCITGRKPQAAPDRQLGDDLIPLSECAVASYPRAFLKAIDSALNLKPALRPQSVSAWRKELFSSTSVHDGWLPNGSMPRDEPNRSLSPQSKPIRKIFPVLVGILVTVVLIYVLTMMISDNAAPPATTVEASTRNTHPAEVPSDEASTEANVGDAPLSDVPADGLIDQGARRVTNMAWATGTYSGEVVDGVPNGLGEHLCCGGVFDKGNFVRGIISGKGIRVWPDGDRYEGNFIDGLCKGQGALSGPVLSALYKKNGRFDAIWFDCSNAQGIYTVEGNSYPMRLVKWKWMDPPLNGEAISAASKKAVVSNFSFAGGIYSGEFIDGKPNGTGEHRFSNGIIDRGEFIDGKLNGQGTRILDANGKRFIGNFKDGICIGDGVLVLPRTDVTEPDKFEANFSDCINAVGTYFFAEGRPSKLSLVNGKWAE